MTTWITSVLSLWAVYWAAMFAQVAYLRTLEDGVGAVTFSWISRGLLAVGLAIFLMTKGV